MSKGATAGAAFQSLINHVNASYERMGRAYITRKAVPGKYIAGKASNTGEQGHITLAEYRITKQPILQRQFVPESKAEPDYGGIIHPYGQAIFFDAKTTKRNVLDFDNLHAHQIDFLIRAARMGAMAGFLVEFSSYDEIYFLPITIVESWREKQNRKSIPHLFFAENLPEAKPAPGLLFDYLAAIQNQSYENTTRHDYQR
ncbi:MAG: Holliday junction resolvase RecU [Acidobacteria bacterium]|nr:Holliday junction resolvase RecU [Acidobacteriota bacterium]